MNLQQLKFLKTVETTFEGLENGIRQRNLTDYTVSSIQSISNRVGAHVEERSFEGYGLEALVGQQIEDAGIEVKHNTALDEYWYDLEIPGGFVDVKKHSSWQRQTKWLSIHNSVLEFGGQLRHLRDYGDLKNLCILFMNVQYRDGGTFLTISPSWAVKADMFFDCLNDSKNPSMKFFDHRKAVSDIDYIRFNF